MFCTNCGEEMRPIDKFCASCGAAAAPRPARARTAAAAPGEASAPPRPSQSTAEVSRAPMAVASATSVVPPRPLPRPEAPPPLSSQEEQQVLLEGEEMAATRGMVPMEALPPEFPPAKAAASKQACAFCGAANPAENQFCERCGQRIQGSAAATPVAHSAWLDVPEPARKPVAAAAPAARTAATAKAAAAPPAAPVASPASGKSEDFFYFYDDESAQKGNGKLLIVLMVVLALGLLGVIYLMSRPSAKSAVSGNVTVVVSPTDAQTVVGGTQDFSATVTGSGDTDVTWSVAEGNAGGSIVNRGAQAQGGSVASLGAYTAPATPGTYHVIATSKADATKSATVEVLVSGK